MLKRLVNLRKLVAMVAHGDAHLVKATRHGLEYRTDGRLPYTVVVPLADLKRPPRGCPTTFHATMPAPSLTYWFAKDLRKRAGQKQQGSQSDRPAEDVTDGE